MRHAAGNPHIQTDPRNIALVAEPLARRLAELDPANASVYQARSADFMARWKAAIQRWDKEAAPLRGVPVVVLGDFNSPSHLDWTQAMVGKRKQITAAIAWPVTPASTTLRTIVRVAVAGAAEVCRRSAHRLQRRRGGLAAVAGPASVRGPGRHAAEFT